MAALADLEVYGLGGFVGSLAITILPGASLLGMHGRCRVGPHCDASSHAFGRDRAQRPPHQPPTSSSTRLATCTRGCAPIMSRNPMTASSSRRRSTACSPASIRIRATWIRVVCATSKCRPAANSAGSASRSRWTMAWLPGDWQIYAVEH